MIHSVSDAIIVAGSTEHKVKGYLNLVVKRLFRASHCTWKLYTYQKCREKGAGRSLSSGHGTYFASRSVQNPFLQVSGVNGRGDTVLRKGRCGLLVRRAVSAYLIIRGNRTSITYTITIPSSHLCHARRVRSRHLKRRYQLQPYPGYTNFIKQSREIGILRYLLQHILRAQIRTTST